MAKKQDDNFCQHAEAIILPNGGMKLRHLNGTINAAALIKHGLMGAIVCIQCSKEMKKFVEQAKKGDRNAKNNDAGDIRDDELHKSFAVSAKCSVPRN